MTALRSPLRPALRSALQLLSLRPTASLDLPFVGVSSLDPRITFTRALNTATYFNAAGVLTSAAADVPRFDYNPTTLASQGLLIEEQRVNSIRNNTMVGAVAGTPGTLPTNWAVTGVAGIVTSVVSVGVENGTAYVDIRYNGTSTAGVTSFPGIFFDTTTGIAALPSQTWAASVYLRLIAGTAINYDLSIHEEDSGGLFLRSTAVPSGSGAPTTGSLNAARRAGAITTGASTAFVRPAIATSIANGQTVDYTLRIGLPQLELGAFATSVIPTSTVAVTRSADVASVNTLSPWYNTADSTVYTEFLVPQLGRAGRLIAFDDGTTNNVIDATVSASNGAALEAVVASVYGGFVSATTISANTTQKAAFIFSTSTTESACLNAGTVSTAAVNLPTATLTRLLLGRQSNGVELCGYLRRITYYPRRLSNAELQAITV